MKYVDCKKYAQEILDKVKAAPYKKKLAIITVGEDEASKSYVKGKMKDCEYCGISVEHIKLEDNENAKHELIYNIIRKNRDVSVAGIIVQLPLPKWMGDSKKYTDMIEPHKDVDGFRKDSPFKPCTPKGIMYLLEKELGDLTGMNALVIGRSDIVGKPLAQLLTNLNCTVTIAHSKTPKEDLKHHIKFADIVFTAIDKIEHYGMDYEPYFGLVPVIIDIGLGRNEQGKLKGNLSTELVEHLKEHGNFVISGIGGVGLLTRLQLLENTVNADRNKEVEKEI
jgi:methylenetetrahydrofolate dehydrogenase (NADP+)/methenyltetrahydrofolate cyclohydrolase